ncbi:MAG: serine/threonine-protein kinase [Gemmatimonadota bacterium]|jgi:serine/threonine-protein kinase
MDATFDQLRQSLGDDFELVRRLGEGAFAEVHLARETSLERPVAVKVLRGALAFDETARKRFLREARLAARIHHPNVTEVYRVGELADGGRPFLVMEYIDGRTYADILAATGPLEEDEVRHVLHEVCGALEAAHALGIIHRDVRPGNILRTRTGERVVLADFGLAGILETGGDAVQRLTGEGQILGQIGYAPPEQLNGETIQPGSDIYSLAVTAYELLTGSGPFPEARSQAEQIAAHLQKDPTPVRRILATASPALEDILIRCLQKRPERRPSAALVRKQLSGGPGEAAPEGAVSNFLSELQRRKVYKVGAAYGAFVLIVLAVVDAAFPNLPFPVPAWVETTVVTATLAGIPVALLLGWFFDITGGGVIRTPSMGQTSRGVRILQGIGVVLVLVATALVGWVFLGR